MSIVDNFIATVTLAKKYKDKELIEHLIRLQTHYMEMVTRNHELEEEVKALKQRLTSKGFHENV
jgi:hypothetical protein